MNEIEIIIPDDFHHHLRDNNYLVDTVSHVSYNYSRVLVMPNLKPPVRTLDEAISYRNRILDSIKSSDKPITFQPLMTLYLTDKTTSEQLIKAKNSNIVYACKLYPAGATTNSEFGVTSISNLYPIFQTMSDVGLVLCVHGEIVDPDSDIFDREALFIINLLKPIIDSFPNLKIVMEHITTKEAVDFIQTSGPNIRATITAHHLLYNRNDIFKGGINPHMYCLPILKSENHRIALLEAIKTGSSKFFAGTDSAPHAFETKETSCGCAGIFTAHAAVELYIEAFEQVNAIAKLEGFMSIYGAEFYNLPINTKKIKLRKESWTVPKKLPFGDSYVIPLRSNQVINWKIVN